MASYGNDKQELIKRLRRIEGQVRGIQNMIEEDRYCVDILVQLSAVRSALDSAGLVLLEDHTRGCVAKALRESDADADGVIAELMDVVKRFTK